MRNAADKCYGENQNNFTFVIILFFPENLPVYELILKYLLRAG